MPPRRPPKRPRKNAAAVALARVRWAGVSAAERRRGAQKAIKVRWDRYRAAQAAKDDTP